MSSSDGILLSAKLYSIKIKQLIFLTEIYVLTRRSSTFPVFPPVKKQIPNFEAFDYVSLAYASVINLLPIKF